MYKNITYTNSILKLHGVSFGLYGQDDIDFDATKENILSGFKNQYEKEIKSKLERIGCKLKGFNYHSPHYYNYSTDSVNISLRVENKEILKKAILSNAEQINKALSKNRSYDGYIALTVDSVNKEIERLNEPNYEPDIIVLRELLDIDITLDDFYIYDYFIYDPELAEV